MQVDAAMLATELRRRRVGPRSMVEALDGVQRSTWVLGELRHAPTPLLVLAALALIEDSGRGGWATARALHPARGRLRRSRAGGA